MFRRVEYSTKAWSNLPTKKKVGRKRTIGMLQMHLRGQQAVASPRGQRTASEICATKLSFSADVVSHGGEQVAICTAKCIEVRLVILV